MAADKSIEREMELTSKPSAKEREKSVERTSASEDSGDHRRRYSRSDRAASPPISDDDDLRRRRERRSRSPRRSRRGSHEANLSDPKYRRGSPASSERRRRRSSSRLSRRSTSYERRRYNHRYVDSRQYRRGRSISSENRLDYSRDRFSRNRRGEDDRRRPYRNRRSGSPRYYSRRYSRSPGRDYRRTRRLPSPVRKKSFVAHDVSPPAAVIKDPSPRRAASPEQQAPSGVDGKVREVDEARRDDLTVLILNLSLKATEKDVWKFFSDKAGKVRDIQVIKDGRSGRSKGVAYVELYTPAAVMAALALSGTPILGQPVVIQASQAEKNRAAKASKMQQAVLHEQGPTKLYIGGLVESLSTLEAPDLRELFAPFGEITQVDVHKDPYTGRSKGYAFITFRTSQEAREAMASMNGFEVGGRQIRVGYATDALNRSAAAVLPTSASAAAATAAAVAASLGQPLVDGQPDMERLDDEGGGLLSGVNPRLSLMYKLQQRGGTNPLTGLPTAAPIQSTVASVPILPGMTPAGAFAGTTTGIDGFASALPTATTLTPNICLEPMFTAADVQQEGENLVTEITEDVRLECAKFGPVLQVYINHQTLDGKVWVRFTDHAAALRAHQAMSGRFFAGNRITVTFVSEQAWIAATTH